MSTDSTAEKRPNANAFAEKLASNPDGTKDPLAMAVAVSVWTICNYIHAPDRYEFFGDICREHNIHGQRLAKVYSLLANNKLSDCMAIIFALGDRALPIRKINDMLDEKGAKLDLPVIIDHLKQFVPAFAFLREAIEPMDARINFHIHDVIKTYMARNPTRGEPKMGLHEYRPTPL